MSQWRDVAELIQSQLDRIDGEAMDAAQRAQHPDAGVECEVDAIAALIETKAKVRLQIGPELFSFNWFARDYFASAGSAATNFLRRLDDCRRMVGQQLERVAVAWDSPSFRHQLRAGYKAGRSEKPEGFGIALAQLRTALDSQSDVEQLQLEGFEADDIIASLASMAIDEGCQAIIASSDHDLHQALRPGWITQAIAFNRPRLGEFRADWITAQSILNLYGVQSWQWVDYRVLTGDTSDNVMGCPGVGPKTAATILAACGTLEGFFDEPFKPAISPRLRACVLAFRPMVSDLREIHALRTDLIFEPTSMRP